jgi:hypothetical protein
MPYKAEVINSNHFFLFCVNMSKKKKTILNEQNLYLSFFLFFFFSLFFWKNQIYL